MRNVRHEYDNQRIRCALPPNPTNKKISCNMQNMKLSTLPFTASSGFPSCINLRPRISPSLNVCGFVISLACGTPADDDDDGEGDDDDDDDDDGRDVDIIRCCSCFCCNLLGVVNASELHAKIAAIVDKKRRMLLWIYDVVNTM